MKKNTTPVQDVWNEEPVAPTEAETLEAFEFEAPSTVEDLKPKTRMPSRAFSLAGLKSDFPTAKELEQFVFDETGVSLKLKGIDPEKKYELALGVLTGDEIDPNYITGANPYVDNTELIPEDPIRPIPERDSRLPKEEPMSIYHDFNVPHPDTNMRALDAKVKVCFKTYNDGSISYEIIGPLEKHAIGEKLDKYGRARPEKFVWVDPRTGEQAVRLANGQYTKMGQRLRTLMESRRVNRSQSVWSIWIDRSFTAFNQNSIENPWD